jgi:hypothetical protein
VDIGHIKRHPESKDPDHRIMRAPRCFGDGIMTCILGGCPHAKAGRCQLLGECGANYALTRARAPSGYDMIRFENVTLKALLDANLVEEVAFEGRCVTVRATKVRAAA